MVERDQAAAPLLVLSKITAILDSFTLQKPRLTLVEIQQATGLPASTVQRIATNLHAHAFLDREGNTYRIGMRLSFWGSIARQSSDLISTISPVLERLRNDTGETACFFQLSSGYRVCIALAETEQRVRAEMRVGGLYPVHAGSAGRVLLAWTDADQLAQDPLAAVTSSTIVNPDLLRSEVLATRERGFAVTTGERELGSAGLSAPVFDGQDQLAGAITLQGPAERLTERRCQELVPTLMSAAEECTRLLGGSRVS